MVFYVSASVVQCFCIVSVKVFQCLIRFNVFSLFLGCLSMFFIISVNVSVFGMFQVSFLSFWGHFGVS